MEQILFDIYDLKKLNKKLLLLKTAKGKPPFSSYYVERFLNEVAGVGTDHIAILHNSLAFNTDTEGRLVPSGALKLALSSLVHHNNKKITQFENKYKAIYKIKRGLEE